MKTIVFGEKLEQAAGLTSFIAGRIKAAETYTAVLDEPGEHEIQALGRAGADKIITLPRKVWVEGPAQTAAVLSEAVKEFGADLLAVHASKTGIETAARAARRLNAAHASEAVALEPADGGVRASRLVLDVPEVGVGIIIASGKSVRQLTQRQGRLVRPVEGKKARLYVVYGKNTYEYSIFLRLRGILEGSIRPY